MADGAFEKYPEMIPAIAAQTALDHTVSLDDISAGYEAMRDRKATKTLVRL